MIAVAETPRQRAAKRQWSDPRARALLLARQLLAAERRRVDRLVESHLHLLPLAGGHGARITGLDKEDLTQSAYFGLRRAAETWDPTKGASFKTWCFFGMRDACEQEFRRSYGIIRYPRRAKSPRLKVTSLDAQHDDGSTFGADIVDDAAETPLAAAHRDELRDALAAILGTLSERDRLVVEMRFGLGEHRSTSTYKEIGELLGFSGQWVKQIEERVLDNLRDELAGFE